MSLKFDGLDIPGLFGQVVFGAPEITTRPVKFFQVKGEGEVVGEVGGRWIAVRVLLYGGFTTQAKLEAKLKDLSKKVGVNGTLDAESDGEGDNSLNYQLDYCTFHGWEPIPLNGQEDPGPLPDIAGTLDGGWFYHILLRFRQLRWD